MNDSGRGDLGIVTELDGRAAGVVWALFSLEVDPGLGYRDAPDKPISVL